MLSTKNLALDQNLINYTSRSLFLHLVDIFNTCLTITNKTKFIHWLQSTGVEILPKIENPNNVFRYIFGDVIVFVDKKIDGSWLIRLMDDQYNRMLFIHKFFKP